MMQVDEDRKGMKREKALRFWTAAIAARAHVQLEGGSSWEELVAVDSQQKEMLLRGSGVIPLREYAPVTVRLPLRVFAAAISGLENKK